MVRRYITPKYAGANTEERGGQVFSSAEGDRSHVVQDDQLSLLDLTLHEKSTLNSECDILEKNRINSGAAVSGKAPHKPQQLRRGRKPSEAVRDRRIFSQFIKFIGGRAAKKLNEIDQELERGTRIKNVPLFSEGKRIGSVKKEVVLLPSDRAHLLVKKRQLEAEGKATVPAPLRAEFIMILPEHATRNGLDRDSLLRMGVPADVLVEAKI